MVRKCQTFRGGVGRFESVRLSRRCRTVRKCQTFRGGVGWFVSVRLFAELKSRKFTDAPSLVKFCVAEVPLAISRDHTMLESNRNGW
jgi:hypothetical protein